MKECCALDLIATPPIVCHTQSIYIILKIIKEIYKEFLLPSNGLDFGRHPKTDDLRMANSQIFGYYLTRIRAAFHYTFRHLTP